MEMTPTEKQARIRELQQEIDRRCAFFRIITDVGANKARPVNKQHSNTQNITHGIPGKG